jgi:Flp pilus assembly protein TadD
MSLIVDALRRAQDGVRRAPPASVRRAPSVLTLGGGVRPGLIVAALVVLLLGAVAAGLLHAARPRPAGSTVRPVLVLEPVAPPPATPPPAAEVPMAPPGPDVAAALAAERARSRSLPEARPSRPARVWPGDAPPSDGVATAGVAAAPSGPPPRRPAAPASRAATPLPAASSPPGTRPPAAGTPPARAATPPATTARTPERASAPSPVVTVDAESDREARRLFAAALGHHRQGQLDRAIDEYEKAAAVDPRNPAVFNNLGVALRDRRRLSGAVEAFERALALDPKYEKALNNLGVARFQQGEYQGAIEVLRQALRINPANVESLTNLGMIYLLAGRHDEAQEALQAAVRLAPTLAEAHYHLGLLWERRGHRDSAERHYRRFLEAASPQHGTLAAQVRERLDAAGPEP